MINNVTFAGKEGCLVNPMKTINRKAETAYVQAGTIFPQVETNVAKSVNKLAEKVKAAPAYSFAISHGTPSGQIGHVLDKTV